MNASPQLSLIDDGHVEKLERERAFELDRTPGPVCHQGLLWGLDNIRVTTNDYAPPTMIDIGAGSGVFGQQIRKIARVPGNGVRSHSLRCIAIEPREEERPWLERHYDEAHQCRFSEYLENERVPEHAWCASNPAFSIFPTIVRELVPRLELVLLYGSIAWGCSEEGAELFAEYPPIACARVIGRVHHRGPGINPASITKDCPEGKPWGADQRDNCWWLWKRGNRSRVWTTENLAPLTSDQRRWTIPPGQEP